MQSLKNFAIAFAILALVAFPVTTSSHNQETSRRVATAAASFGSSIAYPLSAVS